jgi:hypothetical protein
MKKVYVLMLLVCFSFSCQEEGEQMMINDEIDMQATLVSMGEFVDVGTGHNVSGKTSILVDAQGKKILRLEDFSVVNGPDVNVYLSKTSSFKDVIDLGDLKGTSGNINYDVDATVNTDEYRFVLIWCVKYAVLFGYAEQKK